MITSSVGCLALAAGNEISRQAVLAEGDIHHLDLRSGQPGRLVEERPAFRQVFEQPFIRGRQGEHGHLVIAAGPQIGLAGGHALPGLHGFPGHLRGFFRQGCPFPDPALVVIFPGLLERQEAFVCFGGPAAHQRQRPHEPEREGCHVHIFLAEIEFHHCASVNR